MSGKEDMVSRKDKINELEQTVRKQILDFRRGVIEYKKGYQLELTWRKVRMIIHLQILILIIC
jgi:hypothetical protein